jgi:hypothetical protein
MLHGEVTEKDAELHTLRKSVKSLTVDVERESKAAAAAKQQQQKVGDACLQRKVWPPTCRYLIYSDPPHPGSAHCRSGCR